MSMFRFKKSARTLAKAGSRMSIESLERREMMAADLFSGATMSAELAAAPVASNATFVQTATTGAVGGRGIVAPNYGWNGPTFDQTVEVAFTTLYGNEVQAVVDGSDYRDVLRVLEVSPGTNGFVKLQVEQYSGDTLINAKTAHYFVPQGKVLNALSPVKVLGKGGNDAIVNGAAGFSMYADGGADNDYLDPGYRSGPSIDEPEYVEGGLGADTYVRHRSVFWPDFFDNYVGFKSAEGDKFEDDWHW